jgi:hypothetical protein
VDDARTSEGAVVGFCSRTRTVHACAVLNGNEAKGVFWLLWMDGAVLLRASVRPS